MRRLALDFAPVAALASMVVLSACGGKEQPPATEVPTANTATPAAPAATAAELEAESSLSVKRGILTLTAQTRSFRLCGTNVDLTLTDQLDGALDRVYAELG